MNRKRIGILVSGYGSNMAAIIKASKEGSVNFEVGVCISDRLGIPAIQKAMDLGVPVKTVIYQNYTNRQDF